MPRCSRAEVPATTWWTSSPAEPQRVPRKASLLVDPADHLTRVHCPVLAIFGERDLTLPAARSAKLNRAYLERAGDRQGRTLTTPRPEGMLRLQGFVRRLSQGSRAHPDGIPKS
jgi:pimeloyl-ACP methyl ester carboxylesterase